MALDNKEHIIAITESHLTPYNLDAEILSHFTDYTLQN